MIEFEETTMQAARIKVMGIGGGGCNAVDNMIRSDLQGVDFVAANTDVQDLHACLASMKIQLGARLTKGLGAGANPEVGRSAALEDIQQIKEALVDTDMLFITSGMGGGTGTGGAPVVANLAREMEVLTVAVVTKPFFFEGKRRCDQAERGILELEQTVDTLITIPNDRLLNVSGKETRLQDAFALADDILLQAVKGISDIITIHGIINVDFADVMAIMNGMGMALMGTATASGENRGVEAAHLAISSPLLEDISIEGATGILINITGSSKSLTLDQVKEAVAQIHKEAHEEANIIFGAVIDEDMGEDLRITIIATGFNKAAEYQQTQPLKAVAGLSGDMRNHDFPTLNPKDRGFSHSGRGYAHPVRREPFDMEDLDIPTFLRKQAD
jgi:cell division protein FtsZ